ncbi:MAG TPA: ATP-binding protein [Polyangia bacterium]|jgi:PAS domain S-box-containing protein
MAGDQRAATLDGAGLELAACLDALPYYALLIDADHRILFANRAAGHALGRAPLELLGAYCPLAVHGLDAPFPGCPLEEAVHAGGSQPIERELHEPRTGGWASSNIYPTSLRTSAGRPVFLHLVRDISSEKRNERDAGRERECQAVLADILRIALTDVGLDDLLALVLERVLAVPWLQVEPRGAIFLAEGDPPVLVLKAQHDLPAWTRDRCQRVGYGSCLCGRAAAACRVEFAGDVDARHEHCDRELSPHGHYCVPIALKGRALGVLNLYLRPGHERDAREEAFLGAVTDVLAGIVEHGRGEEERRRLATAVAQSTEAVAVTDPAGIITYVNPTFERLTGWTRADVVGGPIFSSARGVDPALRARILESARRDGEWHGRIAGRRKDGGAYVHDLTVSAVHDQAGHVTSLIVLGRDRTQELQLEAQLRQSQKLDALGQLAAGVAHEFRNALFVIQARADVIRRQLPRDEAVASGTQAIAKVVERCTTLTRQLLAFGRQDEAQPQVVDVNAIIGDLAQLLRRTIGAAIELTTTLTPHLDPVRVDPGQLEQVLVNLVLNARDAMPHGGTVRVATGALPPGAERESDCGKLPPGRYVTVSVADTGFGMTPEVRERVFEPFFTTKEPGKGTGLGLASVYGIVTAAGGGVGVTSAPGRGSTFTVYLPCAAAAAPAE